MITLPETAGKKGLVMYANDSGFVTNWNVTPLLGDFGGRVGFCGIL